MRIRLTLAFALILACDGSEGTEDETKAHHEEASSSPDDSNPPGRDSNPAETAATTTDEASADESTSADGSMSEAEETCFDRRGSWTWTSSGPFPERLVPFECGLPSICDDAKILLESCGGLNGGDDEAPPYDPAPGICILEALAAGTPATHEISRCPGRQFGSSIRLHVLGDGTVLWSMTTYEDLGTSERETWRAMLSETELEACDASTPGGLWSCVAGIGSTECQFGEPVCPTES